MTAGKQIVSVFGSVADVSEKLKAPQFSGVTVHSALEILLSGAVGLEITEYSDGILGQDMCFLSVPPGLNEATLSSLLSDAALDPAPLNVTSEGDPASLESWDDPATEDDPSDPFQALADDMTVNTLGDSMARLQDTVARIREFTMLNSSEEQVNSQDEQVNPQMATILGADSLLGSMLPEGTASAFMFCQLATVKGDANGPFTVEHDVSARVFNMAILRRIDVDDEGGTVSSTPYGEHLFISDRSLSYIVESGTPSIITMIIPKSEETVEVRTWFVYLDSVDGMNQEVSKGVIDSVRDEISSEGVDAKFVWPSDFALSPLHVSSPSFDHDEVMGVASALFGDDDEDDEDDED